ncbi:hypothetical protein ACFV2S_14010 [Streptomyces sp. NPDC059695]|uniref:hypothetical protein n=1 Tax=Streptomyces sp. NPDC059695 TaxID=3346910 RepID=UPI0036870C64
MGRAGPPEGGGAPGAAAARLSAAVAAFAAREAVAPGSDGRTGPVPPDGSPIRSEAAGPVSLNRLHFL